jgi:hypothetical protein
MVSMSELEVHDAVRELWGSWLYLKEGEDTR